MAAIFSLLMVAILVYQFPPVNNRLSWRVDIALTYMRSLFSPAGGVPTPQATPKPMDTLTPLSSPTPQPPPIATTTITPTASPTPLPASVILTPPKWESQDWNNCGPASLSMYLHYYGWEGNQHDISDLIKPTREDRNVNVE